MTERIDSKLPQVVGLVARSEGQRETPPHSPRWRSADFSFRLTGVMDLRSGAEQVSNASSPASRTEQSRNPHESEDQS